jgi:hypothetical protein
MIEQTYSAAADMALQRYAVDETRDEARGWLETHLGGLDAHDLTEEAEAIAKAMSLVDLRRMLTTARDTEIEGGLTVTMLALGRVDDDHDFGGMVVDLDDEAVTIEDPQRRRVYPVVYDLIDRAWTTDANGEVREVWSR